MNAATIATQASAGRLNSDQILQIARLDAERAYRNLDGYRISLRREEETWFVDYDLKDEELNGGGPHYEINARTGAIINKRYEQ